MKRDPDHKNLTFRILDFSLSPSAKRVITAYLKKSKILSVTEGITRVRFPFPIYTWNWREFQPPTCCVISDWHDKKSLNLTWRFLEYANFDSFGNHFYVLLLRLYILMYLCLEMIKTGERDLRCSGLYIQNFGNSLQGNLVVPSVLFPS